MQLILGVLTTLEALTTQHGGGRVERGQSDGALTIESVIEEIEKNGFTILPNGNGKWTEIEERCYNVFEKHGGDKKFCRAYRDFYVNDCYKEQSHGPCTANHNAWYYDLKSGKCKGQE